MEKTEKKIDYLDEDTPISTQKWVCISFLSPEGIRNCKVRGLKFRGSYSTKEEANERASYLQKVDPDFHVFVGEIGKWLPWDPDPNSIEDQVYKEDELNKLMKNYKENLVRAKEVETERKNEMIQQAKQSNKTTDKLKKKIEERQLSKNNENDVNNDVNNEEETEFNNKLKNDIEKIEKLRSIVDEGNNNISEIDEKLQKISDLYNKINKKE